MARHGEGTGRAGSRDLVVVQVRMWEIWNRMRSFGAMFIYLVASVYCHRQTKECHILRSQTCKDRELSAFRRRSTRGCRKRMEGLSALGGVASPSVADLRLGDAHNTSAPEKARLKSGP